MELQRIVRAQADVQPRLEKLFQWIPLVRQEQGVVAQRTHRDPDLLQIKQVLQGGDLAEQDSVRDRVRCEVGGRQVVRITCLPSMWTEDKGI